VAALTTTLGPRTLAELGPGPILPHEHIFVDLRTWDQPGYGEADPEDVVRLMAPEIERARAFGVTAIVEPSTVGVGRRADVLLAVSRATGFPLAAPTGGYREPWLPPWIREAEEAALRDWLVGELSSEIEGTGVPAGWIKVGASDEGMTPAEAKLLRAAAGATRATGATVGSHTLRGAVARAQLDLLEGAGADPRRFVWIHAHREPDIAIRHELARRGAWLEYDAWANVNPAAPASSATAAADHAGSVTMRPAGRRRRARASQARISKATRWPPSGRGSRRTRP